jgi:ribose transport system substrate-binding protein
LPIDGGRQGRGRKIRDQGRQAWDGPTSGPKAQAGKSIVVLAGDMKNGGILGVVNGVQEAATAIGWTVTVLDGAGSIDGRTAAFGQAMALKPDGIIINGFDAVEQKPAMERSQDCQDSDGLLACGFRRRPGPEVGVFANVTTDAMEVSKSAADYAYVDAGGKPGVIIFTDSTYAIAIAKADRMKKEIEKLGGTVLEYVDTPIAETSQRMPQLTTTLLQKVWCAVDAFAGDQRPLLRLHGAVARSRRHCR